MNSLSKGTAVITGASTGIGAVYADRLARRGYDLILIARNRERLETLAAQLRTATGRAIGIEVADLTKTSDVKRVADLLKTDASVSMLVNNAGVGAAKPLVDSDIDQMDDMISINVNALTRLAYAVVPAFLSRGAGTIINIASIVAIAPEMLNGVYGASKAYVLALTRSLQHELGDKGLRFQAVCPGATATAFWDIAGVPVNTLPAEWVMTADAMVDAALAGLDQGELITIPALPDVSQLKAFESAREAMMPNLSLSEPAARYRTAV
jgi:short-subunit dehydrogenase